VKSGPSTAKNGLAVTVSSVFSSHHPHNRLKVAFSHFFWLLLHSLKIIHKFATEKRIHSAKLIPFNIMKSSNINPSA
jgi:hypothetical protein